MSPYYLVKPMRHYLVIDVRNYLYWIGTNEYPIGLSGENYEIWFPVGWKH